MVKRGEKMHFFGAPEISLLSEVYFRNASGALKDKWLASGLKRGRSAGVSWNSWDPSLRSG
jgi:hypothetical protein